MRDRKLAEMMGMDYPQRKLHDPDFSTPEWRARLMDWAVEQEWWGHFAVWAYGTRVIMRDKTDTGDFVAYLWCDLPQLVDEYLGMK